MKTKEQRYNELYSSGLVNSVKKMFANRNDISEDYYVLMADYIDSMNKLKDQMLINPTKIAKRMPKLVKSINETHLGGIYGRTDDNIIQMEQSLSYEDKKLYFFHELTHALQTSHENGIEQCGFYNGHDGMFLTEGATQYTAEMLYSVSNGVDIQHRQQPRTVRGASDRTPNSPLSEYQYNGDILELMAKSMDLPLPQILSLAYKKDGRETLKEIYESMDGNQGKFDGLMNKTERELAATYLKNHDTQYILQNYSEISSLLTTPELKNNFLTAVNELSQELYRINRGQTQISQPVEIQKGYSINEFGEIIRSTKDERQPQVQEQKEEAKPPRLQTMPQHSENKLSIKQKIAKFLQKNNLFMNMSFVEKFVHQQLELLPESTHDIREVTVDSNKNIETKTTNKTREDFINQLTNFGAYRNLPPIQRMSDSQKLEEMRRKREEHTQENDDLER